MLNLIYTKKFTSPTLSKLKVLKLSLKNISFEVIQEIQAKIPKKQKFQSLQKDPKPYPVLQKKKIQRFKAASDPTKDKKKEKNPEAKVVPIYSKINPMPKSSYKKEKKIQRKPSRSALQERNPKPKSSYKKKKDPKEIQSQSCPTRKKPK